MTKGQTEKPVFRPGGAKKLLEHAGKDMSAEEQALLLVLIDSDAEAGESLDESERAALEKLRADIEGYDTEELAHAVKHIVSAKPKKGKKLQWPELSSILRRRQSGK